ARTVCAGACTRIQSSVYDADDAAQRWLAACGYRPVRIFRELRITHSSPPRPASWPEGLRVDPFDVGRDAKSFHAAQQEAFSDNWEYTRREFSDWSSWHLEKHN